MKVNHAFIHFKLIESSQCRSFIYLWKKFSLLFSLFVLSCNYGFSNNYWNDISTQNRVKAGINYAYNFEFEKAEAIRDSVVKIYSAQPSIYLFDAIILYWKNYPLIENTAVSNQFESLLMKTIDASKLHMKKYPQNEYVRFFAMMPRLMLLQHYADNGQWMKSIPHLSKVYGAIVEGFEYCKTTPEFYFTTGLYDYYIEAYPAANPFYKPFVFFFPRGNKEEGLKELYKCWQLSKYIGAEALTFLTYIYINFETNYSLGLKYATELANNYPNNLLFADYNIQLLLLNKQYEKAEMKLNQIKEQKTLSPFFKKVFNVYDAIILEQYHKDLINSKRSYLSTISDMEQYGTYANRYQSYAYFGLTRICKKQGLETQVKQYRSQAFKKAQYPHVNFD